MPNFFNWFDLIRQMADSYAAAGAAGGLVSAISKRESVTRALLFAAVGAMAAYYLGPILTWTSFQYIAPQQTDQSGPLGTGIAFATGLTSMRMAGLFEKGLEKVLDKWQKK